MAIHAQYDIGFNEALASTLRTLARLAPIEVPIGEAEGLVGAEDCTAKVDCPSSSVSLKDGYAVVSADLTDACDSVVKLRIVGRAVAGVDTDAIVQSGTAVGITSGAKIPPGADAVIASEFTTDQGQWVLCHRDAGMQRNIRERGHDVRRGSQVASSGEILTPARTGLMAAGGIATIQAYPRPRIGIIATGDEIVAPGQSLKDGQVYASNVITLHSWLRHFRMDAEIAVVPDHREHLAARAAAMLDHVDVLITSGGAWKSDRDLTVDVLKGMGADLVFHRVRMGPGKAVALLVIGDKTVFCLPGGPASNEMAFLQITLPALLHLCGRPPVPFARVPAILTDCVRGDKDWTQFTYVTLEEEDGRRLARPLKAHSRLQSQADAEALIQVPEGVEQLDRGTPVYVQVLHHHESGRVPDGEREAGGGSATVSADRRDG